MDPALIATLCTGCKKRITAAGILNIITVLDGIRMGSTPAAEGETAKTHSKPDPPKMYRVSMVVRKSVEKELESVPKLAYEVSQRAVIADIEEDWFKGSYSWFRLQLQIHGACNFAFYGNKRREFGHDFGDQRFYGDEGAVKEMFLHIRKKSAQLEMVDGRLFQEL